MRHLEDVLSLLENESLHVKESKCDFGMMELVYLGHIISLEGVSLDPKKKKAIVEWPTPTNLS